MRVLIIDDDAVSRGYLERILSGKASAVAVHCGQEGLKAFEAALWNGQPFDAVLMDICMPGMDGHQTLENIRNLERQYGRAASSQASVFVISALDDSRNVNRAFFQGGAVSYLVKPVTPASLLAELGKFGLL